MDSFDDVIREAIQQLPAAFESQSAVPPHYEPERLDEYFRRDDNITLLPRAEAQREDEVTAELDARDEIIADFERANSEAGFEALAFYISFHNRTEDGKWGVFYYDDAIRALAVKIRRDLPITDDKTCYRLAVEIVRKHELFHFRFDLFALQQELTLKRPLYNKYQRDVYQGVLFTEDCYEESLANASSVSGWSVYKHLADGLINRSFSSFSRSTGDLNIEDFIGFAESDGVQRAIFASLLHGPTPIDKYVRELCKQAPPGYCDFDRDSADLRSGLGGQLLTSSVNKKLLNPQAAWVGRSGAFAGRKYCPEYLLSSKGENRPGVHRLIVRSKGEVWEFHKYDVDPWPSKPHGHNRETGEKLDLAGGWIYDRNRNPYRRCTKKGLAELRAWVEKRWPNPSLPPLVWAAKSIALG
jgi:hypothetical protein